MSDQIELNKTLRLRRIAGVDKLKIEDALEILKFISVFFSELLPNQIDKLIDVPFFIDGFNSHNFHLKNIKDLKSGKLKFDDLFNQEVNNIFISDIVGFLIEAKKIAWLKIVDGDFRRKLEKTREDLFSEIGAGKLRETGSITLKTLDNLENNPINWRRLAEISNEIIRLIVEQLIPSEEAVEEIKEEGNNIELLAAVAAKEFLGLSIKKSKKEKENIGADGEEVTATEKATTKPIVEKETPPEEPKVVFDQEEELRETIPENLSAEFNLAKLDDKSKLYVRSLAIISVNQALQLQFANLSSEQLKQMGFDQMPTFDQLPGETQTQLMSIAFGKIENNLVGKDLEELFNSPGGRINLAKDAAIDILTDIRGGQIFATNLGRISKNKAAAAKEENQEPSTPSLDQANNFFKKIDSNPELKKQFLEQSKKNFSILSDDDFFQAWRKFATNESEADKQSLFVKENLLPAIDTFIQQNYPVSYLEKLDWQRFKLYFGDDVLDENSFIANHEEVKELLAHYWRNRRSTWSQNIHRGINQELYTQEQVENLYQEMTQKNPGKKLLEKQQAYWVQQDKHTELNRVNSTAVSKLLAGIKREEIQLELFNEEQQAVLFNFRIAYEQQLLTVINSNLIAQQATLAYYDQTIPGGSISLNAESFPEFSRFDLGAINYSQLLGQDSDGRFAFKRKVGKNGALGSQLRDGFSAARNFSDSTIGKGGDLLLEKGVGAGLTYLTGGAYAALPSFAKKIIEKEASEKIKPALKILGAGLGAAILALVGKFPSIGKGISSVKAAFGGNNILEGGLAGQNLSSSDTLALNQGQKLASQGKNLLGGNKGLKAAGAKGGSLLSNIGQNAMATAGQAVVATFTLVTMGTILHRATINSAFLTQFSTSQTGSGGSAVFCKDVNIGNLTYYSQRVYNEFMIDGDVCSFGSSACGPTTVAMILGRDPLQMSIEEGFVGPNGESYKLFCDGGAAGRDGGSTIGDLKALLEKYGHGVGEALPLPGNSEQITDELEKYLREGNIIFARARVRGFGHFLIITCVEKPGYISAYDAWWGQNAIHHVVDSEAASTVGSENIHIYTAHIVN